MQNATLAQWFEELADRLEIQGANPFRVRAYRNAARTFADHPEPLAEIVSAGRSLQELPGIGQDLADKAATLITTGSLPQLEELRAQIPQGVLDMLRIPGLGPKKAAVLFHELAITSLDQLRAAAESGAVAGLKGFGKKTAQAILEGLQLAAAAGERVYLAEAKAVSDEIVAGLLTVPGVYQAAAAGSVRRRNETIGDLDVLATAADSAAAMDFLAAHALVEKVLARGDTKQRVRLKSGLELDLRVVADASYGAALQYFTGSKEHNILVRKRALERGLKINEYGVYRDDILVAGHTEDDVYAAIGLPWIPPELREGQREMELAETGRLPRLIELADIRGDLHSHTTATDGQATIREMIAAAQRRGLEYFAITDHSKRVTMANGLDADRLRAHWREIEQVRRDFSGIEVLRGIECDILEDATLDLDDEVLAEADWVVAVLHYGLKQPAEQVTRRLLSAIANPYVSVIGHPTARIVGKRPPVAANMEDVLKAAADQGVMMEINAHPSRLDLDDVLAASAKTLGIPLVISTDAHSVNGFDVMQYGVYQARRAGLEAADVANTRPWHEFRQLLHRRRG